MNYVNQFNIHQIYYKNILMAGYISNCLNNQLLETGLDYTYLIIGLPIHPEGSVIFNILAIVGAISTV